MHELLLFSHANGFPAPVYRVLLEALAGQHRVVGPERIGHDPRYPVSADWPHLVEELVARIRAAAGDAPRIWLVGHSLGGYLSLLAAHALRPTHPLATAFTIILVAVLTAAAAVLGVTVIRPVYLLAALVGVVLLVPALLVKDARAYWLFLLVLSLPLDIRKHATAWLVSPPDLVTEFGLPATGLTGVISTRVSTCPATRVTISLSNATRFWVRTTHFWQPTETGTRARSSSARRISGLGFLDSGTRTTQIIGPTAPPGLTFLPGTTGVEGRTRLIQGGACLNNDHGRLQTGANMP